MIVTESRKEKKLLLPLWLISIKLNVTLGKITQINGNSLTALELFHILKHGIARKWNINRSEPKMKVLEIKIHFIYSSLKYLNKLDAVVNEFICYV